MIKSNYTDISLSRREADCVMKMHNGRTVMGIAKELRLSQRSVKFYIKNISRKLNQKTES